MRRHNHVFMVFSREIARAAKVQAAHHRARHAELAGRPEAAERHLLLAQALESEARAYDEHAKDVRFELDAHDMRYFGLTPLPDEVVETAPAHVVEELIGRSPWTPSSESEVTRQAPVRARRDANSEMKRAVEDGAAPQVVDPASLPPGAQALPANLVAELATRSASRIPRPNLAVLAAVAGAMTAAFGFLRVPEIAVPSACIALTLGGGALVAYVKSTRKRSAPDTSLDAPLAESNAIFYGRGQ